MATYHLVIPTVSFASLRPRIVFPQQNLGVGIHGTNSHPTQHVMCYPGTLWRWRSLSSIPGAAELSDQEAEY